MASPRVAPDFTAIRNALATEAARLHLYAATSPEPCAQHHWIAEAAHVESAIESLRLAGLSGRHAVQIERYFHPEEN